MFFYFRTLPITENMKKFVVTYHMTEEAWAESAKSSPEETQEGMKQWMAWAERMGPRLIDFGTPLMGGQALSPGGGAADSAAGICGYSIIEAENMEAAIADLQGHPHLAWRDDCQVQVHESMPPPGS